MSEPTHPEEDIILQNERSLSILIRASAHSQNRFSLILVRCNYTCLREQILKELQQRSELQIREIPLDKSETNLYTTIMTTNVTDDLSATSVPKAVMVSGLECVTALDDLLISMNRVRNDFLSFSFPLVFWINDAVLQKFIKLAPDFYTYAGVPIKFAPATNELVHFLQHEADSLFTKILEAGADQFLDNAAFNLGMGAGKRFEIESALQELDSRGCSEPELEASQQFILGRDAYVNKDMERSRQLYEESLAFWQQGNNSIRSSAYVERQACLLFHLGLWWRRQAVLHRAEYETACRQAQDYYQQCIEILQRANRSDLAAKFINSWAEVLQQLEQWDKLEAVAKTAIELHKKYPHEIRRANAHAFLAEIALVKRNWNDAKQYAQTALTIIAQPSALPSSPENLWVQQYYQSWYHLLLAKAQQSHGELKEALQTLELAKEECKTDYHPQRYVRILDALRELYYEQHRYLEAFELKQEKSSIEQQYGFRAFIGAGQLQSQRQVLNPVLGAFDNGAVRAKTQQGTIAQEIIASGRDQDVDHLIERISRDDQKLMIIYGPSGVGKSSLLTAGLVPALKNIPAVDSRDPLPVIVRFYTNWVRELGKALLLATPLKPSRVESQELSSQEQILQQLRRNADGNFLTILIFDQFEEFFFNCFQPAQRKEFWQFLKVCLDSSLDIPYVKIFFSVKEYCLPYLLECDRIVNLEVTNNDILNKDIRYYLGNFSPDTAKKVIESLTQHSSYLEPSLIDELVRDLAEEHGEVRPIELQVVGVQLEREKIKTLEEYQRKGPKEQLVQRFLDDVVKDCGQENESVAQLVLYFLTDENDTRPLKTRAELLAELVKVLPTEADKLELVLKILVKSGIVFLIPQLSTDYYQLVHDYLVSFIRKKRGAQLYTELKREKEKRQLAEAQRLRIAYGAGLGLAVLTAVAVGFGVKSTIGEINAQLTALASSSEGRFAANLHEEALIESIKGGEKLQQTIWANWVEADAKIIVKTA